MERHLTRQLGFTRLLGGTFELTARGRRRVFLYIAGFNKRVVCIRMHMHDSITRGTYDAVGANEKCCETTPAALVQADCLTQPPRPGTHPHSLNLPTYQSLQQLLMFGITFSVGYSKSEFST